MNPYIAKRLSKFLGNSPIGALNARGKAPMTDLIDLGVGDTDFVTDRRIIEGAFRDLMEKGGTQYGSSRGETELIDAVRDSYREDHGISLERENVLITTSSCMGMSLCLMGVLNPGDEVLLIAPYFLAYGIQVELAGGVPVEVPTYEEDGFCIREEALRAAITDKTRAIIINNPCNPTGAFYDRKTLETVAAIAEEFDLIVLADEIYTYYIYEESYTPFMTLPGMAKRTLTLNSFSKNFIMTGWRIGFIVADPEIINAIAFINDFMVYAPPRPSQRAAIHALHLRHTIAAEYVSVYKERLLYAAECFREVPYITVPEPKGTFYLFPNIKKTGLTSKAFSDIVLEKAHVKVAPGSDFGAAGEGYFRIACACVSKEKIAEAAERMKHITF